VKMLLAAGQISTSAPSGGVFDSVNSLETLFTIVTNAIIMMGLGLVLVFLALGFIRFITSQGDKVATEQAQKWVTYAIVGGVGLLAVYAIKKLILSLVGAGDNPGGTTQP